MSSQIIASLRKHDQLRGTVFQAAKELAHRADENSGEVTISYSYLASKCHQSRRTAIRHIQRLLEMGIIARARFWRPGHLWGANRYKFLIRWERPPAQMYNGAKLSSKFPEPEKREEREKYGSLADLQKAKEKVLGWLTEGSALWKLANEF